MHSLPLLALWATPAFAFWVLNCANPLVIDRVDPILSPGRLPAAHLHTIMGGDAFSANTTTFAQTRSSSCTSCSITADMSNYWVPQLFFRFPNGTFSPVPNAGGMLVYYLQRIDPRDPEYSSGIRAFPPGFRMLAGDALARRPRVDTPAGRLETRAVSFACLSDGPSPATNNLPNRRCKNGLRAQINFPSCWDGVNLDSADHRSHVVYPSQMDNGICPTSHPKRLVHIFYEVVFQVDRFDTFWDPANTTAESGPPFAFSNGDQTGYGYHGDFLNGWDVDVLQKAITGCDKGFNSADKCPELQRFVQPVKAMKACTKGPEVGEQVTGMLSVLPGCNPVPAFDKVVHPAVVPTCAAGTAGTTGTAVATTATAATSSIATASTSTTSAPTASATPRGKRRPRIRVGTGKQVARP